MNESAEQAAFQRERAAFAIIVSITVTGQDDTFNYRGSGKWMNMSVSYICTIYTNSSLHASLRVKAFFVIRRVIIKFKRTIPIRDKGADTYDSTTGRASDRNGRSI